MSKPCLPKKCNPTPPAKEIYPPATEAFSFCVGNDTLTWNGTRLTKEKTRNLPDGTWGKVSFRNGCVVGVAFADEPSYTPPYCNPSPIPCGGDGSGGAGGASVTLSPKSDNLTRLTPQGLYTKVHIKGATGDGTATNPFVLTPSNTGGSTTAGNLVGVNGVEVTTTPQGVAVGLSQVVTAGKYGKFTIDSFGRITSVSDSDDDALPIQQGEEISVVNTLGVATVDIKESPVGGEEYKLGAYNVSLSRGGRIIGLRMTTNISPKKYRFGDYDVTLDSGGNIIAIEEATSTGLKGFKYIFNIHTAVTKITQPAPRGKFSHYSHSYGGAEPAITSPDILERIGDTYTVTITLPSSATPKNTTYRIDEKDRVTVIEHRQEANRIIFLCRLHHDADFSGILRLHGWIS